MTQQDRADFLQFKQDFNAILQQRYLYINQILAYFTNFGFRLTYLSNNAHTLEARI